MIPEKLKTSLIKYAIQGKLVEQRASEGDAFELCEKAKQIRSKNGKPSKSPKNNIEIPFDIPATWQWVC